MSMGFKLTKPTYNPRELATLFTAHVRPVSYPTVLNWLELARNSGGRQGVKAGRTPRGRYHISADEVRRVLLEAGAHERDE